MIDDLDASLKAMLLGEAATGSYLKGATITFAAPTQAWQGKASGMTVNVYLYRVQDNRELRSNARAVVRDAAGGTTIQLAPARIECSYLVTAWDMGADVAGFDKEPTEHALLDQALRIFWANPVLPQKYLAGSLASPGRLALPIVAAEGEDMAAKPDFWGAFESYVRPALTCRVTLELDLGKDVSGPPARTFVTDVRPLGAAPGTPADTLIQMAGMVRSNVAPFPAVANAWVRLDATPVTAISDADGLYRIAGVSAGVHQLTVRATGFAELASAFAVPAPGGSYDISLTPL